MFLWNMLWSLNNNNDGQDIDSDSDIESNDVMINTVTNKQQNVDHSNDRNWEQNISNYNNPNEIEDKYFTELNTIRKYDFNPVSEVFENNGYSLDEKKFDDLENDHKSKANLLGRGGFGKVVVIHGIKDNEKYALKQMNLKGSDDSKTKKLFVDFKNEVFHLIRMNGKSDHIVKCLNHFRINDNGFIVLEYANRGSVDAELRKIKIEKNRTFTENKAMCVMKHTAQALYRLHNNGIAHKDLKLANILKFKQPDGTVIYKVCDFGKSRLSVKNEYALKQKGAVGTVNYMSPELLRCYVTDKNKGTIEGRVRSVNAFVADMWALGICQYYLLCNDNPFINELEREQINRKEREMNNDKRKKKHKTEQAMLMLKRAEKNQWKIPRDIHKNLSKQCIEFMESLIEPDRMLRLDIYDAVAHKWILCHDLVKEFIN